MLYSLILALSVAANNGPQVDILEFTATWCGPCRTQAKEMQDPQLIKLVKSTNGNIIAVDIDQYPRDTKEWDVKEVPTIIIVRTRKIDDHYTAKEIARYVGVTSSKILITRIYKYLEE